MSQATRAKLRPKALELIVFAIRSSTFTQAEFVEALQDVLDNEDYGCKGNPGFKATTLEMVATSCEKLRLAISAVK